SALDGLVNARGERGPRLLLREAHEAAEEQPLHAVPDGTPEERHEGEGAEDPQEAFAVRPVLPEEEAVLGRGHQHVEPARGDEDRVAEAEAEDADGDLGPCGGAIHLSRRYA